MPFVHLVRGRNQPANTSRSTTCPSTCCLSTATKTEFAAQQANTELITRMYAQVDEFNQRLQDAGAWVFAGGLAPHHPALRSSGRNKDADTLMTDGPYIEAKEQLGGFWIIKALTWTRRSRGRRRFGCLRGTRRGAPFPGGTRGLSALPRVSTRCRGHRADLPRGLRPRGRHPDPPLRHVDVAEEAVQDAFDGRRQNAGQVTASRPSPAGWIITTARRRAIDRLRRESSRNDRHLQAALLRVRRQPEEVGPVRDDQLRLMFTCCHPALAAQSRVALTLRLIAGLTTPQIARGVPGAARRRWLSA